MLTATSAVQVKKMAAFLLLLLGLVMLSSAQESIICPLPGNPTGDIPEETCTKYTACAWDDGNCYMLPRKEAGYSYSSDPVITDTGFKQMITKTDSSLTMFDEDIEELQLEVLQHEDYHLQIRITDPTNARYEVPVPGNYPPQSGQNPMFTVKPGNKGDTVLLSVNRTSNGNELFRQVGPISYENQFLQLSTLLPSSDVYGLGETSHTELRRSFDQRHTRAMFARDAAPDPKSKVNLYGTYPYFVNVEDEEGNTHSVLFMNSNAMEYSTFTADPRNVSAVTLRSIGGIIDIHIFAGPTPEDVNTQYMKFVGTPALPPYWSLGFQLSRWGYKNTDEVREVRQRMQDAEIPQDVQYFDIDYMDRRKDFTYDQDNFGDLSDLVEELNKDHVRTTIIVDPAIAIDPDYSSFMNGKDADAYIKWMSADLVPSDQPDLVGQYVVSKVWPDNRTVYPDFFNPAAQDWWTQEISDFHKKIGFSGLWIDMNEPSSFDTNLFPDSNWDSDVSKFSLNCPENKLDTPPYGTLATFEPDNRSQRLSEKTICMSSNQTDGQVTYLHYDVHSLYGYFEMIATERALLQTFPGERPFVLSRSSFVGSGHHGFHWLGDNAATWEQMAMSVIGIIEFNMFGIPMVGADICGFNGATTMELCARWTELGAFYPFSRNHNSIGQPDQDPASWPEVAAIAKDVLNLRYRYIPYLYALFHNAHMSGHTVVRPLFNVFRGDQMARGIDDQFFWGDGIMVAPVMEEGATSRPVYFPEGDYYDLETGVLYCNESQTIEVDAPLEKIPVYVRGGVILPFQEPAITTDESRMNDFGLLVALDAMTMNASGEVFWDDGTEVHNMSQAFIGKVVFAKDSLTLTGMYNRDAAAGVNLATVRILGFPAEPNGVKVNEKDIDTFKYDEDTDILDITINLPLSDDLSVVLDYQTTNPL